MRSNSRGPYQASIGHISGTVRLSQKDIDQMISYNLIKSAADLTKEELEQPNRDRSATMEEAKQIIAEMGVHAPEGEQAVEQQLPDAPDVFVIYLPTKLAKRLEKNGHITYRHKDFVIEAEMP